MINDFLGAFIFIFIAEMGDKTQILAMAFATKYSFKKVLLGIFLGSLLNHGLAVILGSFLSNAISLSAIQVLAGFAFILFALWTLKIEQGDENQEESSTKFGPVITVALAFFIGELGDKTQLVAITLASDSSYPIFVLAGTVLGMTFTGALGILLGRTLGAKIPELTIKVVASSVFMIFGLVKLYQNIPVNYLTFENVVIFTGILFISIVILVRKILLQRKMGKELLATKVSKRLYDYYNKMDKNLENLCLGIENCKKCKGNKCALGYTKKLVKKQLQGKRFSYKTVEVVKEHDKENLIQSLIITLRILKEEPSKLEYEAVNEIRKKLEILLFKKSINNMQTWQDYQKEIVKLDRQLGKKIFSQISKSK